MDDFVRNYDQKAAIFSSLSKDLDYLRLCIVVIRDNLDAMVCTYRAFLAYIELISREYRVYMRGICKKTLRLKQKQL